MNAMLAETDSHSAWLESLFDVAFAAPGGMARLRQLILTLAMQGTLVPQLASEASASEWLKQVAKEKTALVKAGKVRAPKATIPIADSEKPYITPEGWEWARLSEFAEYNGRSNIDPEKIDQNAWVLDLEDIEKGTSKLLYRATYAERGSKSTKSAFKAGDVLYGKLRPYLDKVIVAESDGVCTTEIVPIVPSKAVIPEFLRWLLKRPAFLAHVNSLMYGVKMPRLGTDDASNSIHPLPPLEEQRRIIARIDELMSRCDELESQRNAQEAKRREARAAAVRQWLAGDDAAVALLGEHFATLVSTREDVAELRKAILQLAVMGKLVAQVANGESASELLKQITAEKEVLAKAGKIKQSKPLEPVAGKEKPYTIPESWEWVRFDEIINQEYPIGYGVLVPGPDVNDGVPFVRIQDLDIRNPKPQPGRRISQRVARDFERTRLVGGEILMGVVGSIGKLGIAPPEWRGAYIARAVCRIVPTKLVCKEYILWILQGDFLQASFRGDTRTLAQPTLNIGLIRNSLTPLPPLEEQNRIVARIDTLMQLCDALEQSMDGAQAKQTELLDAIMARV